MNTLMLELAGYEALEAYLNQLEGWFVAMADDDGCNQEDFVDVAISKVGSDLQKYYKYELRNTKGEKSFDSFICWLDNMVKATRPTTSKRDRDRHDRGDKGDRQNDWQNKGQRNGKHKIGRASCRERV